VRITYTVNLDDYIESQRLFRRTILPFYRRLGRQAMMFFGAALLAAAIFLIFSDQKRGALPTILAMGFSGAALIALYAFYPDYMVRRKFRTDGRIRREMSVDFSAEGVRAECAGIESYSAWKKFEGYAESSRVYLLFLSPRHFLVFPKRAFPAAEIGAFRELLEKSVPRMKSSRNLAAIRV
jgi:YcxB-like protein